MLATNLTARLILGHMPFIGVSYQSEGKDEEYRRRFSQTTATRKVVEAAINMGLHKFASATPHSSSLSLVHLEVMRLLIRQGHNIKLFPCIEIPIELGGREIDAFRRWATYENVEARICQEVKQRIFSDPILNFRRDWRPRLSTSRPYKEKDFRRLAVDLNQIDENLRYFTDLPVGGIELGSETDFLTMTRRFDLLGELIDSVKQHGFKTVLLGVHHAGVTIPMLEDELGAFHGYVTPLNPLGVMMFPTKRLAEKAVRSVDKAVYAIKPLAGGRVDPRNAFTYVFNFNVTGCMIGVGSVTELKEDVEAAFEVLERPDYNLTG